MDEEAIRRRRERYHQEGKPWWRAGMTEETYAHLLAFVAANPRLVHKLIVAAAEAIEGKEKETFRPIIGNGYQPEGVPADLSQMTPPQRPSPIAPQWRGELEP